jgi:hypothetical protein
MPQGVFLGDDDISEGPTYGLEGLTGQATDVAGGNWVGTMGSQFFCAVVDYTKVRWRWVAGRDSTVATRLRSHADHWRGLSLHTPH